MSLFWIVGTFGVRANAVRWGLKWNLHGNNSVFQMLPFAREKRSFCG